ncbi:hypothetical protein PIB30_067083 [Stylosanthes scabra]|uniref:Uncharacterized protein n=1 Tax=Stylosanthes scabra TaxID=79078 RepID=A0ABU6SNW6_9FABA|nr:hypothetical protein [Stylosanthes scabra]
MPPPGLGIHLLPKHDPGPNSATPRCGTRPTDTDSPRLDHVLAYSTLLEDKQSFKFGVGQPFFIFLIASSSAPVSVFDEHRFRKEFNQELFNSHARKRKVLPEVGFNLNEDEYPLMELVSLRGWRRLAAPRTNVSEMMVQEFYANAAISDEEAAEQDELPYKSFVRGIKVDFSPSNIRRVMRFKGDIAGAQTDY